MSELYFPLEPSEEFIQSRKDVNTELLEQKIDGFKMVEGIHQHPVTDKCMEFANAALLALGNQLYDHFKALNLEVDLGHPMCFIYRLHPYYIIRPSRGYIAAIIPVYETRLDINTTVLLIHLGKKKGRRVKWQPNKAIILYETGMAIERGSVRYLCILFKSLGPRGPKSISPS
ncbi:hypothetical protein ACQKWADRAFT_307154 [Trichoderma austrokoningii]